MDLSPTRRRSVISLTPLIDVVFILLLFFMLASNFSHERSVVWDSTANGVSAIDNVLSEPSRLHLQSVGFLQLDGQAISQRSLLDALVARRAADPTHSVVVSVGEEIDVQTLLSFIVQIKQTGVEKVVMSSEAIP